MIDWDKVDRADLIEAAHRVRDRRRVKTSFMVASTEKGLLPQIEENVIFDVCERIAEGGSIADICTGELGMPKLSHLLANALENPTYGKLIEQALRMKALKFGDEAVSDAEAGMLEDTDPRMVASRRLLIDSKRWYAAKLMPRLFGEKVEVDSKTTVNITIRRFEAGAAEGAPDA